MYRKKVKSSRGDSLTINEKFVNACANGDFVAVNTIIENIKDFNIDVSDNLGRTGLRLAVANENLEVIQLLLNKSDSSRIREALLLAIYMGHTQIAQDIIKHPQYKVFNEKKFLNNATDSFWQTPGSDDAQFSPDITPVMLASQYNRSEILQMLLQNGDRIEKPHDFHCKCNECGNRFKFDSLRHAQSRLNAYRGLASESYISLASIDPILTSFEMAHELNILAEKEKYFKHEYLELAKGLTKFVVKLLNNVRGRDELEIVLNKNGKENEEKFSRLARLDLAIKYQQMPFVAHPNCQQKLIEIWYTDLVVLNKMNRALLSPLFFLFILFVPFGSIAYMLLPNSKFGKFMSLPLIKFLTFTLSYLVFMGMVIASVILSRQHKFQTRLSRDYKEFFPNYTSYVENENLTYRFVVKDFILRDNSFGGLDICICTWLFGIILREIKKIYIYGIRDYLDSWSNIMTVIMWILFITSYGLNYYTAVKVKSQIDKIREREFWNFLMNLTENAIDDQKQVYETFYWLNADRFYWHSLDPVFLSDCLYSLAIIFSFARLCFWLPANQNLGPLQITLGRMITNVGKFLCIFAIVFSGFLFGLHSLFGYYEPSVRAKVEITPRNFEPEAGHRFGTVSSTLITMFFALYALGASDDTFIEPYKNQLTPNIGFVLFALFHIINIVILISMLIAMLTKSFDSIMSDSDTEWKFSRSRLYMEFIKEGSVLPIPLNLVPTPSFIYSIIKSVTCFIVKKTPLNRISEISSSDGELSVSRHPSNFNETSLRQIDAREEDKKNDYQILNYQVVIERVVKRFLIHNFRENEDVKEDDFDEVKGEVDEVRYEFRRNVSFLRESTTSYIKILHKGLSVVANYLTRNEINSTELTKKLDQFRSGEDMLKNDLKQIRSFQDTFFRY